MAPDYKNIADKKSASSLFVNKVEFKNKVPAAFLSYEIAIGNKHVTEKLKKFTFQNFYHPYFELLLETMNKYGFPKIFDEEILDKSDKDINGDGLTFKNNYNPNSLLVSKPFPIEEFTFDIGEPYALDNWMTFYHMIILIVETLLSNNKNDEAILWIEQCLYNPKAIELTPDPKHPGKNAKYWKLPIFKDELTKSTTEFFNKISNKDLQDLIGELDKHPFSPFLVAYHRKQEFMMYVVNLYARAHIAQGDIYFRMAYNGGGMDYLNLAVEYYKVAKIQFGNRIQTLPNILKKKPESYNSLKEKGLKPDVNALVQFENIFPYSSQNTLNTGDTSNGSLLGGGYTFYFSIPPDNSTNKLNDLIDDRLFKLRNCRDIDGIVRKIDLFGTPINPAQLLAALAKGLSLGEILGSMFAPPPLYKVSFAIQKAKEFCNELKALGSAIVTAIEKGNAEELAFLQATHETDGLNRMLPIKERQVYQAQLEKQGLLKSREIAISKVSYYRSLLGITGTPIPDYKEIPSEIVSDSTLPNDTNVSLAIVDVDVSLVDGGERGVKIIPKEKHELEKNKEAQDLQMTAGILESIAGFMHLIPMLAADVKPFGIGIGASYGGPTIGQALSATARAIQTSAGSKTYEAGLAAKLSGYIRREQEWAFQTNLAEREIVQIDKNLAVSDIKIQSAQVELDNLKIQITESQEKHDFLANKETNYAVYYQIKDKLKTIHKNFHDLTMYYARSAEQAYQYEKPEKVIDFISYNYDSSIVGYATVADELTNSINQMEKSYLSNTLRPLEMRLNISLSRLDPIALLQLRKSGKASVNIPEWFLLLKNRSIYNAKWISVNFTFPMITGPYTNMNARIVMSENYVRIKTNLNGDKFEMQSESDDRFVQRTIPFNKVLITHGNNDPGFNLDASATGNELYQHQYRPFEQAGVVCGFDIDLNSKSDKFNFTEFNWDSLSDVIISGVISVDIDEGKYKEDAEKYLNSLFRNIENKSLSLFIDIKHDLPNELYKFTSDVNSQSLVFNIDQLRFPYMAQDRSIKLTSFQVITKDNLAGQPVPFNLQNFVWKKSEQINNDYQVFVLRKDDDTTGNINITINNNPTEISIKMSKNNVADSYLVIGYTLS